MEVSVAVTSVTKSGLSLTIEGVIVSVLGDRPSIDMGREARFSILRVAGTRVCMTHDGPLPPRVVLHPGSIFRTSIDQGIALTLLEQIAKDEDPGLLTTTAKDIRPMDEPCLRVPLSVLAELRGQEAGVEYARRAILESVKRRPRRTS